VGVHFNTLVELEAPLAPLGGGDSAGASGGGGGGGRRQLLKYGVMSAADLCADLLTWRHLYGAGRLHKPVATLAADGRVAAAQAANLRAALDAALLLSPRRLSAGALARRIVGLSYAGDVRMGLAEDAAKVARIAAGSAAGLAALYGPAMDAEGPPLRPARLSADVWQQDDSREAALARLARLPAAALLALGAAQGRRPYALRPLAAEVEAGQPGGGGSAGALRLDVAAAALRSGNHAGALAAALAGIVRRSSERQALAGLLAAGPAKSAAYLGAKLAKGALARWRSGGGGGALS
jgi:translocator assembly and maintenance protein 41